MSIAKDIAKYLKKLWGKIMSWLNRNKHRPMPVTNLTVEIEDGTSDT